MIPEDNLDEDILQCRAEILRALRKEEKEKEEPESIDPDTPLIASQPDHTEPDASENQNPGIKPESDLMAESDAISGDILHETSSESYALSDTAERMGSPETPLTNTSTNTENPSLTQEVETLKKTLRLLREQKENLSQTCQEQENHIRQLTEEIDRLQKTLQQTQETCSVLTEENSRFKTLQQETEHFKSRLEQAQDQIENLNLLLSALKEENEHLRKEKIQISDRLAAEQQIRQSLQNREMSLQEEINSLQDKTEALQKTVDAFHQEIEHLRQQNASLERQIQRLEQNLLTQQAVSLKTEAALREGLEKKTKEAENWKTKYERVCEQLASEQEDFDAAISEADIQTNSSVFEAEETKADSSPKPQEAALEEDKKDFAIPRFDLSEQILSAQRRESSARRQPPTSSRIDPNKSVRSVVHQFLSTPPAEKADKSAPRPQPLHPVFEPAGSAVRTTRPANGDSLIAEIVRRDIEQFCRNHPGVYIEFPCG